MHRVMERGRSSFVEPSPLVGEGEGEGGSGPHEPGGSALGRRWNGELMGLVSYPARHQENQQYMERSGSLDQNEASGQGGMRTGRTRDADNQQPAQINAALCPRAPAKTRPNPDSA